MGSIVCSQTLRHIRTLFSVGTAAEFTDGQLLERFTSSNVEDAGSAFAVLVERHGPMVLRACRAVLRDEHDACDAFQVVFLVLLRKVRVLRVRGSLGPWLHQVAFRISSSIRSAKARRSRHEQAAAATRREPTGRCDFDDLSSIIHEEINRLPERLRRPLVLCCLEGLSREQAARHLGWPLGTVQSRLARGRERLRVSLTRRGLGPPAALIGSVLSAEMAKATVATELAAPLIRAATRVAVGKSAVVAVVPVNILALTEGVLKTMVVAKFRLVASALLVVGVATAGAGVWASQKSDPVAQLSPVREQPINRQTNIFPSVVARVDGTAITREELIERCLAKHGAKELESLVGLTLLREACRRRGITVTNQDVDREAAAIAKGFGLSVEDWFGVLSKQRGISRDDYLNDVVPARIMVRKLGITPSKPGFEGLREALENLDGKVQIETYWPRSSTRGERDGSSTNRPQEDRLRDVERKLDSILKTLDGLRREEGQPES